MLPIQIIVNNKHINLLDTLPQEINSLNIAILMPIRVRPEAIFAIKKWLNALANNITCDFITYNNVLINTNEIKLFKDLNE